MGSTGGQPRVNLGSTLGQPALPYLEFRYVRFADAHFQIVLRNDEENESEDPVVRDSHSSTFHIIVSTVFGIYRVVSVRRWLRLS